MKLKELLLAAFVAATAASAHAGDFYTLNNGNGSVLTAENGGQYFGVNDPLYDPFYLQINTNTSTFAPGTSYGTAGAIPTKLNYTAKSIDGDFTTTASGSLTLLDSKITTNYQLLPGVAQGTVYDFVFRDSRDNKLVFGTRFINAVDNDQEVNFLFRQGAGDNAAVAWTRLSQFDLRLYQGAQTDDYSLDTTVDYENGFVRLKSDISVGENNPWSGLYLVKTDATGYTLGASAVGIFQAGEEGQNVAGSFIQGFVGVTTAVPEPESYALMMLGMGVVAIARRRQKA